jgi:hypothetical protein
MTTNPGEQGSPYYFDGVKIGDKVWCFINGKGVVDVISPTYPIRVVFESRFVHSYNYNGSMCLVKGGNQSLFWDEIKFTPPPKPKRMVQKKAEAWANVYPPKTHIQLDIEINGYNFSLYKTKESAENNSVGENIATAKVQIEWEEEE